MCCWTNIVCVFLTPSQHFAPHRDHMQLQRSWVPLLCRKTTLCQAAQKGCSESRPRLA